VIACVFVIVSACSPDADNTAFLCDSDRGGDRGCPTGQSCISGRCRRGGATATVRCDSDICSESEQCCVDGINAPRCIAASASCPGAGAICDQRADCVGGDYCCSGLTTACGESCEVAACLVGGDDCPSPTPNCCFGKDSGDTGLELPWGRCSAKPCP
jgi:hypothetical protein